MKSGWAQAVELLLDAGADGKAEAKPWREAGMRSLKGFPGLNANPCQLAAMSGYQEVRESPLLPT